VGDANAAAAAVVSYLDGRGPARGGRAPGHQPDLTRLDGGDGLVGYYADSVEGPGTWLGRGMTGVRLSGQVDTDHLRAVLVGRDPFTGAQLADVSGSARRAEQAGRLHAAVARGGDLDELLTLPQAAGICGVSPRYLRRLVARTAEVRVEQARQLAAGEVPGVLPVAHLDAVQSGCNAHWKVSRAEVARFVAERKAPVAVVGYDLTFSVQKSVSVLWATADPARQAQILAAVDAAVAAGVAYLEDHAAYVRVTGAGDGVGRQKAGGIIAASYLHATSRALDPQLHRHVVVANMAQRADGAVRALDGRAFYAHARTAGHLADAELRTQLTRRLGVEWDAVERGVADVAGVPESAMAEMSRRAADIDAAAGSLGLATASGRQVAAYATRAPKAYAVDPEALRLDWHERLAGVGFDLADAASCYERQAAPALVTKEDRAELATHLGSARGITEMTSVFDRRDVIQAVSQWAGDRLGATEICDIADEWLTTEVVVSLDAGLRDGRSGDVIRRSDGRAVSAVADESLYTTVGNLALEDAILAGYEDGLDAAVGVVPAEALEAALAERPYLSEEQVAMVRSVTGSGQRIQCVVGSAGAGKTTALEAAARAWEAAGYRPVGAAVGGTAAELLGSATGMESSTVASLLARLDAFTGTIDSRTVVVVDEASTLANLDLLRLERHVARHGGALRLVGDPAQHSAVAAGGAWRRLVELHPTDTPVLGELHRQKGPDMAEVRLALGEYREGKITQALERLRRDDRVVEAPSADELLDTLVADWFVDRQRRQHDPSLAPSSMVADHHVERRELNRRARAVLAAAGELSGPSLDVGDVSYQVGDEVMAVTQDPALRSGAGRSQVRNGERGRVSEVLHDGPGGSPALVVAFERRGDVVVPHESLTRRVRPGVVGSVAHSYALTSFAAQGETYEAGRHLASDASSRPGVYVGLTRGRSDVALYVVAGHEVAPRIDDHPDMPRLEGETTTLRSMAIALAAQRPERLAQEVDPLGAQVAQLRRDYSLIGLESLARSPAPHTAHLARRALTDEMTVIAERARLGPDPAIVARLGPRPPNGPLRHVWDQAVGEAALYRARWGGDPVPGTGASWALGRPPQGPAAPAYRAAAAHLRRAEVAVLADLPTTQLATERAEMQMAVALDPTDSQRSAAYQRLGGAAERLERERTDLVGAQSRLQSLVEAPRRRRNTQSIELARRSVDAAAQRVANAELSVTRAEEQVAAVEARFEGAEPVRQRLALVDDALAAQVDLALERPAPYIVDALGKRPDTARDGPRWDSAARQLETYRHAELGLSPADGPLGDDGLAAAIGPSPDDYLDRMRWEGVAHHVSLDPEMALEIEGPALEL